MARSMRPVRAAELSVLWYTAGKGEEDMAVHHFERLVDEPARPLDLRVPHRFATVLPPSPLSYDGADRESLLVRARATVPAEGQETVAEVPFRLGNVPPASEEPIERGTMSEPMTAQRILLSIARSSLANPRSSAIPSRRDNPFATCWTSPGASRFDSTTDNRAEQLVAKLAAQNWTGAIIGPHGSGKSTLFESLKTRADRGWMPDPIRWPCVTASDACHAAF